MKTVLKVDGMSCNHCVEIVTDTVSAVEGVQSVEVCLDSKTVSIEHADGADLAKIKAEIEDQGYDVIG
ncbi:MAG: cation transporter [Peptostreptococcaceae bacterium]|nr:cation transporter [Peptostreptococcaceae bacterium]